MFLEPDHSMIDFATPAQAVLSQNSLQHLHNLCRAAGFSEVRTINGPPTFVPESPPNLPVKLERRIRGIPDPIPSAPSSNYRAVVHAYV